MYRAVLKVGFAVLLLVLAASWRMRERPDAILEGLPGKIDLPAAPISKKEQSSGDSGKNSSQLTSKSSTEPSKRLLSATRGDSLSELEAESTLRWSFKRNPNDGFVTKMSEGRLPFAGLPPEVAAMMFLDRFGNNVLGFRADSAGQPIVSREEETTQVVLPQILNGLSVYGARGNFTFDAAGNLIYAISNVYRGPVPPTPSPAVSASQAAQAARQALLHYLTGTGADPAIYPIEEFRGQLMYRLLGNAVSLVYRYEVSLVSPLIGDMEIIVDANMGAAVLVRNQTRK